MDELLHELTHNTSQFQNEWNDINKRSQEISIGADGITVFNTLADYVINQPINGLQYSIQFINSNFGYCSIFLNNPSDSSSTLNNKQIMKMMRKDYQELYRYAIKNAGTLSIWTAIEKSLSSALTELFDTYDPLTDAEQDLILYPDNPNHKFIDANMLINQVINKHLALVDIPPLRGMY